MNHNGTEGASEVLLCDLHVQSEGNDNQVKGLEAINQHRAWQCN